MHNISYSKYVFSCILYSVIATKDAPAEGEQKEYLVLYLPQNRLLIPVSSSYQEAF